MTSHTTQAGDWFEARKKGLRLPAHTLRCIFCNEASEEEVCETCLEAQLETLSHERASL
jgi:hypothetical protein